MRLSTTTAEDRRGLMMSRHMARKPWPPARSMTRRWRRRVVVVVVVASASSDVGPSASVMAIAACQVSKSSLRGSASASHTARAIVEKASSPGKRRASIGVSRLRDAILNAGLSASSKSPGSIIAGLGLVVGSPGCRSWLVAASSSRHALGTNARIASSDASDNSSISTTEEAVVARLLPFQSADVAATARARRGRWTHACRAVGATAHAVLMLPRCAGGRGEARQAKRAEPRIELGTSCTQSRNHTTRPHTALFSVNDARTVTSQSYDFPGKVDI